MDAFFVLSEFLIASIILRDILEGSFSIRESYLRRIQRLLPNTVVTVLAVLLLWTLFLPPSTAIQAGYHGLWTLFNLSDIYIWRNLGGCWGDAVEWAPLTHTWSLGIEKQFYLFFPGSLLLLARFQPSRLSSWLAVATALSFGICLYGTRSHPTATFYLLPTRVWELLLGAVLAAYRTPLVLQGGDKVNFRELTTWRMRTEKGLPRLDPNLMERLRKQSVATATAVAAAFPNLRVLRADLPFYQEDGSIRYASGRTFFYADDDHLSDMSTEVVRGLFQSAIAEVHSDSSSP